MLSLFSFFPVEQQTTRRRLLSNANFHPTTEPNEHSMMVVSADKAREKAEARRLRILAKANERLDVVSGLVPSSDVTKVLADTSSTVVVESPSDSPRAEDANVINVETSNVSSSTSTINSRDEKENKGSRRMVAMRKRRAQARAAKEREGESTAADGGGGDVQSKAEEAVIAAAVNESAADLKTEMNESTAVDTPVEESMVKSEEVAPSKSFDNKIKVVEEAVSDAKTIDESKTDFKHTDVNQSPTVPSTESAETSGTKTTTEEEQPKKSYVGVAKMRRRILKQQKAQRLQSITDSEALQSDAQMERELVAEVAAMGVTAKMAREGVDVCSTSIIGGAIAGNTKRKKSWLAMLLPPMHTFSRIFTMVVLFGTGLRLGMETHTVGVVGGESFTPTAGSSSGMIHHVESALTKPWEYGMGGKMAYMVGTMPTAPPTALPTRFHDDTSCLSNYNQEKSECAATATKAKQSKKKDKEEIKINMIDMEDEFDTGRVRPRGVTSEFEESIPKVPNIDPVFRADLDELLSQSALPFPIDHAAKFAIRFHRMWVYYLWTMPKKLLDGWIRYPPVVLMFTLLIRAVNKVLLGGGKKLEEDGTKNNSQGGFDVMKKVMDSAKSYIEGSFPWLVFVLGTLYDVVKIDMYVVFCGLLVGLIIPLNGLGWSLGFREGHVLGDGEL